MNTNNRELKVLRIICLAGALITPVVTYTWKWFYPDLVYSVINGWIFSFAFLLICVLTYKSSFVREKVMFFSCGLLYLSGLSGLYFAYVNDFSEGYALLSMLVIFGVAIVFKKPSHLIYYMSSMLVFIFIALNYCEQPNISMPIFVMVFIVFGFISYMSLIMRVEVQEELVKSEERYTDLLDISPVLILIHSQDKILYANPAVVEFLKMDNLEDFKDRSLFDFIHGDYHDVIKRNIDKVMNSEKNRVVTEIRAVLPCGELRDVEFVSNSIIYMNEPAIMAIGRDVTERKQKEREISHMAYHDALTDLPNRYLMYDFLEKSLARSKRKNLVSAVMFMDLDRFKVINDSLGHHFGDLLLMSVSDRMKKCVRKDDIISRYGGDEFVIIQEDISKDEISSVASRVIEELSKPFVINGVEVRTSSSIGISMYPDDGDTIELLIKCADTAMYYAKEKGRNNYQYFTHKLDNMVFNRAAADDM